MTTPIAMSLNLNADQQAPLAALRKKNLNHEKEDMIELMKATKIQLKVDVDSIDKDDTPVTHQPTESDSGEEENTAEVTEAQTPAEIELTTTPVEQRLKQITEEVEKLSSKSNATEAKAADVGPQSFFSLSDLIKNLRPNDKITPQIDSDYSNTMRVLGETASLVQDESRKTRNSQQQINRSLY